MKYSQSLVRNGLALFIEFIPHAPDGMDHVAIAAELVPEELYLPVHGPVLAVIIITHQGLPMPRPQPGSHLLAQPEQNSSFLLLLFPHAPSSTKSLWN